MPIQQRKAEIRAQYEEAGLWDVFMATREDCKTKLKASGMSAQEAAAAAEEYALETHPLPGTVLEPGYHKSRVQLKKADKEALDELGKTGMVSDDFKSTQSSDMLAAMRWAFDHWGLDDVQMKDAPSSGAWMLREELRKSPTFRKTYYQNVATRLLPSKGQLDGMQERLADDGRSHMELLRSFEDAMTDADD